MGTKNKAVKKRVEMSRNEFGVGPGDIWDRHLHTERLDLKGPEYSQILLQDFTEFYSGWTSVTAVKRKTRWKLSKKLARKKRRTTEKWKVLHLTAVVREVLSHSLMSKCFGMCSHRLSQNPHQEISVPSQGTVFLTSLKISQ
jgi:hypothetical protein